MRISSTLGENNRKRKSGKYIFLIISLNTDNDQNFTLQEKRKTFICHVSKTI